MSSKGQGNISRPCLSFRTFSRFFLCVRYPHTGGQEPENDLPPPPVMASHHISAALNRMQRRTVSLDGLGVGRYIKRVPCTPWMER